MKQYVDSEFCLRCQGCCRFYSQEWAPRLLTIEQQQLGIQHMPLIEDADSAYCGYLQRDSYHCRIYDQRPFECMLYPFLLTRREQTVDLAVHVACPYISAGEHSDGLAAYSDYVRHLLRSPEILRQLQQDQERFSTYPQAELRVVEYDILNPDTR